MTYEEFKGKISEYCRNLGLAEARFRIDEKGRYWAYVDGQVLFGNSRCKCIGARLGKRSFARAYI